MVRDHALGDAAARTSPHRDLRPAADARATRGIGAGRRPQAEDACRRHVRAAHRASGRCLRWRTAARRSHTVRRAEPQRRHASGALRGRPRCHPARGLC